MVVPHLGLDLVVELDLRDLDLLLDSLVVEPSVFEEKDGWQLPPGPDTLSWECNPLHSDPCRSQTSGEVVAMFHSYQTHACS